MFAGFFTGWWLIMSSRVVHAFVPGTQQKCRPKCFNFIDHTVAAVGVGTKQSSNREINRSVLVFDGHNGFFL